MNKQFCNICMSHIFDCLLYQYNDNLRTALHISARETIFVLIESLMMLCKLCTCAYNPRCTNEKWIVKYFEEKIIAWFTISPASDKYGFYEYLP